jgi:ABC-type transport system involved in cytochrome bd biosynthesis fused ATPase/permease subunit
VDKYGPRPLDSPFAAGAELSGGQKRKFSLTCALLRDSVFVFLDEPSTGLSADELPDLISTIRSSCAGKTVMVVDHILPAFIAPLCDYVLVLDQGYIVQRGTPEQLLAEGGVFAELYEAQLPQNNKLAAGGALTSI